MAEERNLKSHTEQNLRSVLLEWQDQDKGEKEQNKEGKTLVQNILDHLVIKQSVDGKYLTVFLNQELFPNRMYHQSEQSQTLSKRWLELEKSLCQSLKKYINDKFGQRVCSISYNRFVRGVVYDYQVCGESGHVRQQLEAFHEITGHIHFMINIPVENAPMLENIDGTSPTVVSQTYASPITQQSSSVFAQSNQQSNRAQVDHTLKNG